MKKPEPFHKSIVRAIRIACPDGMVILGYLILITKIPEGHDAILRAWNERVRAISDGPDGYFIDPGNKVANSIIAQKEQIEKEKLERSSSRNRNPLSPSHRQKNLTA